MVRFLLPRSLVAFLSFPLFLMTVLASAPVSEPCQSRPNRAGRPRAGRPAGRDGRRECRDLRDLCRRSQAFEETYRLENRDQARRQV